MRRLPLFPLPVVLFPGAVMPLHIFEPRYRKMVARCLEYDRRFGLLYHDADRMGPFERTTGRVGTVAEIGEFRILPDGRSLLLARGVERFRIVDGIESGTPYAEALVEPLDDVPAPPAGGSSAGGVPPRSHGETTEGSEGEAEERRMERRRRTLDLLEVVVDRLGLPAEEAAPLPPLDPADEVSFQIAGLIRTDPLWQHALLTLDREEDRLDRIDELLREALAAGDPTREP
jgi:Lon protease-like protein